MLSADELLGGAQLTFDVEVPAHLLGPGTDAARGSVRLRPLTVRDMQLVARAAKDNDSVAGVLMVQAALLEPKLTVLQANALPVGLMSFLLSEVNRISGLAVDPESVENAARDPLVRAAFLLSKEFGWTLEQVSGLTLGQMLVELELLRERNDAANAEH